MKEMIGRLDLSKSLGEPGITAVGKVLMIIKGFLESKELMEVLTL
jgi:hypothetical protein